MKRDISRREFVAAIAASSGAGLSGCLHSGSSSQGGTETTANETNPTQQVSTSETIQTLSFYSPASQVSTSMDGLSDEYAVVRASGTAKSIDTTDSGAYIYEQGDRPPMVSHDGRVVGFGSTELVSDPNGGFEHGNEEFVLNAISMKADGQRVVWDEGHDQYWTLDRYSIFEDYAEKAGYTVDPISSMSSGLGGADAVVITSPSSSFSQGELSALKDFLDGGGAVMLMDQSDFRGHDETGNLNSIAEALDIGFRFNSDQINDAQTNAGSEFIPTTSNFVGPSGYFTRRSSSIDPGSTSIDQSEEYEVPVTEVADGDTANVVFGDASNETVRFLGIDTPELNASDERIQEWSGIDDGGHLMDWAEKASEFAKERLADSTVRLVFDEKEPVRGEYGRLLAYVYYDSTGNGEYDANYNLEAVRQGYARAYASSLSRLDEFEAAEQEALEQGRGLWSASDLDSFSEFRDIPVEEMFFPHPTSVEGGDTVVASESTASPAGATLVSVDEGNRVAAVAAPIMSESYEKGEGYGMDTSGYGNYTFLTNLVYGLSGKQGDVFFEGGHRQFNIEGSLTSEDAAYYARHLEGFGRRLRQVNNLPETLPGVNAASLMISAPASGYTEAEMQAVKEFASGGGSVILIGDARSGNIGKLNEIASGLGTDIRFTGAPVTDPSRNLTSQSIIETSNFTESYQFFDAFS